MMKAYYRIALLCVLMTAAFSPAFAEDTAAPILTITSPKNGAVVGEKYAVSLRVTDLESAGAKVFIRVDNTTFQSLPVPNGVFNGEVRLQNYGKHTNYIYAVDTAGNATHTNVIVVEWKATPSITVVKPRSGLITNSASIVLEGTAAIDAMYDIARVEVSQNGAEFQKANGTKVWQKVALLQGITNTFRVKAVADNSNVMVVSDIVAIYDNVGPVIELKNAPAFTNVAKLMLNVSVSDVVSGVASQYYQMNGGQNIPFSGSNIMMFLSPGQNSMKVGASDKAGNISAAVSVNIVMDPHAPIVSFNALPVYTNSATIKVTVSAMDNLSGVTARYYQVNNGEIVLNNTNFLIAQLTPGENSIKAWASDKAGNVSIQQQKMVLLDIQAPTIFPIVIPASTNLNTFGVDLTISDNLSGVTMQYYQLDANNPALFSGNRIQLNGLAAGNHTLRIWAIDGAGNVSPIMEKQFAVAASPNWIRAYGSRLYEKANAIGGYADGGCIVVGETSSFASGGHDIWIIRVNKEGNPIWQKVYGGLKQETANAVIATGDGGALVVGTTESFGSGGRDALAMKINAKGEIEWQKCYGGTGYDLAKTVVADPTGGYIVTGTSDSFGEGSDNVWVFKINTAGVMVYQNVYGGDNWDEANALLCTPDGGLLIVGSTRSWGAGQKDILVVKTTKDGSIEWQKAFGGKGQDVGASVQMSTNGGFIVMGTTESFGEGASDVWIASLKKDGTLEWQKTIGGTGADSAAASARYVSGSIAIVGNSTSFSDGNSDLWLIRISAKGDIEWQKRYGGNNSEYGSGINTAGDDGSFVSGVSWSMGSSGSVFYVLKPDNAGNPLGKSTSAQLKPAAAVVVNTALRKGVSDAVASDIALRISDTLCSVNSAQ